jgi:hypothetical protein
LFTCLEYLLALGRRENDQSSWKGSQESKVAAQRLGLEERKDWIKVRTRVPLVVVVAVEEKERERGNTPRSQRCRAFIVEREQ